MMEKLERYTPQAIEPLILTVRGQKVILDAELARIYGVTTKVFNQAVKRNKRKFPADFMFQLTAEEYEGLRSQFVTLSRASNRSQFVTGSQKHRNPRYLPYAFTEHGSVMAANVLNSAKAVKMSVFVVRAFVLMRRELISRSELEKRLLKVENILLAHDHHIRNLYEKIRPLFLPPPEPKPEPPKKRIGFLVEEPRVPYRSSKRSKMETQR
jgi:hypothetical protein